MFESSCHTITCGHVGKPIYFFLSFLNGLNFKKKKEVLFSKVKHKQNTTKRANNLVRNINKLAQMISKMQFKETYPNRKNLHESTQ